MNNIKHYREAAALSQTQLSAIVGVSQQAVASWESGTKYPRADKLPRLAAALHCSLSDLFEPEGADNDGR